MPRKNSTGCSDTQRRVQVALRVYRGNPENRRRAFAAALKGLNKEEDQARIIYIRNIVRDALAVSDSNTKKKKGVTKKKTPKKRAAIPPFVMDGARRHEFHHKKLLGDDY